MTPDDFDPIFSEAWAAHEAFRKLGFPSDVIFMHRNPDGGLHVVLKHRGLQFAVTVGVVAADTWEADWTRFAEAVNSRQFSDVVLQTLWEQSAALRGSTPMLVAMHNKGFALDLYKAN